MATVVRLARQGNSTGVTLSKETLDALGWKRGDAVVVTVVDDRVEIRRAESPYQKAMESVERCFARYPRTLKMLAE
jgi:putative addiction module antidote